MEVLGACDLCSADVGSCLVPPYVLLPGLQRQAVAVAPVRVPGHPDHAAGHVSDEGCPGGEEAGVRAAVPERHPEPLAGAERDVAAELPGRPQQRQRQQVRGGDGERPLLPRRPDQPGEVLHRALGVRVLEDDPADVAPGEVNRLYRTNLDSDAKRPGAGLDTADGLWVEFVGQDEPPALVHPEAESQRLRRRRALVQQRGVSHF